MHISYHKNALYNELLFHENCLDSAIGRDDLSETEIIHTERDNPPIKNSIKVLSSNWSKSHSTRADSLAPTRSPGSHSVRRSPPNHM